MITKLIHFLLLGLAFAFSGLRVLGQSQTFLSNLGESPGNSFAVSQNSWAAQAFNTGDNFVGNHLAGFQLNSIQVFMDAPIGNPSGFALSIYSKVTRNEGPSFLIANLVGNNPSSPGIYTFSASNLTLGPQNVYWIVMTSSSPSTSGSYVWRESSTLNYQGIGRWTPYPSHDSSADGITWAINGNQPFQFAINATAVPEPSSLLLLSVGGSFLFTRLARKSRSKALRQP